MSDELKDLSIVAWVGMDELGSGRIGMKQGRVPAGYIPLAAMDFDEHKLKRSDLVLQLEAQAHGSGKRIRLVRFRFAEVVMETEHGE